MKAKTKAGIATTTIAAILLTAVTYLGKQETKNNSGFQDKVFQQEMVSVGWRPGYSWCVYFTKLVWKKSISNDTIRNLSMKLINGNSQVTLANFQKDLSGRFILTDSALPGAIVIFQEFKAGKGQPSGHAGIVTEVFPGRYNTIEGNTNDVGGREGYIVAAKHRKYNFGTYNGLRLRKFISVK